MNRYLFLIATLSLCLFHFGIYGQENYRDYHKEVTKCEQLIAENNFEAAIEKFDSLFNQYDFVFLRDIKVATQLSAFEKDVQHGLKFVRLGILSGWTSKSLAKTDGLDLLFDHPKWENILLEYDSLRKAYLLKLNIGLREHVHEMFKNDQKKAFGALIRIGEKAKTKYAEKKFAPHSEKQLEDLDRILSEYGYPGEQLIGNNLWGSVILSHHNSISVNYNSKDTLYAHLKPKLINALQNGEISPYELAQIEDWRIAALNEHELTSFGFLGAIQNNKVLDEVNKNRADIGLRSIELRNALIGIEQATGLNLYLPKGWQKGEITITNNSN